MNRPHREVIILIGKPGSGKGTQAEPLAQALGLPFVSMGKMLRDEIKRQTAIGRQAAKIVAAGRLVPYQLTLTLLRQRLAMRDARAGIVIDGFPRNIEQARAFEKIAHVVHAVLISITDKEVIRRLSGRRVCSKCGHNYHITLHKPKVAGICDFCGSRIVRRDDDKISVIKERLESYRDDTIPVLHFYRRLRALRRIDGVGTIAEVGARALDFIKESDKGLKIHETGTD